MDFQKEMGEGGRYVCNSKCRKDILKMQATLPKFKQTQNLVAAKEPGNG